MNRRLLLIAYEFPPVGGAGVQRVAKLSKYLPTHGWAVSVLTAKNHSVPTMDKSLCTDVPEGTIIRKAKSWEPAYGVKRALTSTNTSTSLKGRVRSGVGTMIRRVGCKVLQPDPQILWVPDAIRQGRRLLRECRHDAILVTGPPFSSFLVGAALHRSSGLPLVLDYRDEWGLANKYWENRENTRYTRWCQRNLQNWVTSHASTIFATTESSADSLRQQVQAARRDIPVRCLHNGFDPDDFGMDVSQPPDEKRLRISHVGTLWRLTTVHPLVSAVEQLAASQPQLARMLDVELVGRCTAGEEDAIERLRRLPCRVLRRDYVDHSAAVDVMQRSDELCLLLADEPGGERVVPGKTFEYLASNRRILAIAPDGETRNILSRFEGVNAFAPNETTGIARHLGESIETVKTLRSQQLDRCLTQFDRRAQAGKMAQVLNGLLIPRTNVENSRFTSPVLVTE